MSFGLVARIFVQIRKFIICNRITTLKRQYSTHIDIVETVFVVAAKGHA